MMSCQQFKQDFLVSCTEAGLTLAETEKVADAMIKSAGDTLDLAKLLFLGVPVVAGGGAGYVAGSIANHADNVLKREPIDELLAQEKIDAMRMAAQKFRLHKQVAQKERKDRAPAMRII